MSRFGAVKESGQKGRRLLASRCAAAADDDERSRSLARPKPNPKLKSKSLCFNERESV
jgi:hypothetical protein